MIVWIATTFLKTDPSLAVGAHPQTVHPTFMSALGIVSTVLIGLAIWGNEAEYWKYGKAKLKHSLIPLLVTYAIGGILFPTTGWMVASSTGITDFATAASLLKDYSFGGSAFLDALAAIERETGDEDRVAKLARAGESNLTK